MSDKTYKIYEVTNLINGKIYIGRTCQTIYKRMIQHKTKDNSSLYQPIKEYGLENFDVCILEEIETKKKASAREEFWIKKLEATNPTIGYNKAIGDKRFGNVNSFYGKNHTDETIIGNISNQKERKPVQCLETGEVFYSLRDCERKMNISRDLINNVCKGISEKTRGFTFVYIEKGEVIL